MPVRSCGPCVSAQRGKRCTETGVFNVGRVVVLKNPPAMGFIIIIIASGTAPFFFPSVHQGLTLVHISAQRKHSTQFWWGG